MTVIKHYLTGIYETIKKYLISQRGTVKGECYYLTMSRLLVRLAEELASPLFLVRIKISDLN